jgi:hypothetical protein
VRALLDESADVDYIERWAGPLGVQALLRELRQ